MKVWLLSYRERLDAMSLRERVLIFLMLAGVLVALAVTSALDPLLVRQKQLSQKLPQTQAQTQALEAQMNALAEASKIDPDQANQRRLAQLEAQRNSAYAALANARQGLVSADRMTQMLQDLLVKNTQLKLVGIKTLPAASLLEPSKSTAPAKDASPVNALGLYRHGVEITVEGSYPELLAYLATLERLPWRVYWSQANLSVQTYPTSRLTLTVFTLSLDKTWLSV